MEQAGKALPTARGRERSGWGSSVKNRGGRLLTASPSQWLREPRVLAGPAPLTCPGCQHALQSPPSFGLLAKPQGLCCSDFLLGGAPLVLPPAGQCLGLTVVRPGPAGPRRVENTSTCQIPVNKRGCVALKTQLCPPRGSVQPPPRSCSSAGPSMSCSTFVQRLVLICKNRLKKAFPPAVSPPPRVGSPLSVPSSLGNGFGPGRPGQRRRPGPCTPTRHAACRLAGIHAGLAQSCVSSRVSGLQEASLLLQLLLRLWELLATWARGSQRMRYLQWAGRARC